MPAPRILAASFVAAALLLGACSGDDDDAGETATTSTTTAAAAASTTSTAAGASTTSAAGAASTTAPAVGVVLGPDRLIVGGNALVYGAPKSQVRAYLDRALGAPTQTATQECGPGELESFRWGRFSVFLDESGFVGWSADDDRFATTQGIRLGSARSAVEASYPSATVEESSLGTEFFVPGPVEGSGLSGIYESGAVAALWSGATCIAR